MGFLKRILSIGSKRNKKKRSKARHFDTTSSALQPVPEEDHEVAASRLLRSSSARFAVVSELDYASLPPLPHPINNVIQTPAASTISLSSTGTTQFGTYTVKVHQRKHHAHTEFPNANRGLDEFMSPQQHRDDSQLLKDNSQIIRLRTDPSVASLLNLYDEHGRLPSRAFSNTPPSPNKGRTQIRRNGSTFRQLLGNPPSLNGMNRHPDASTWEDDISWAERFLGETESTSSTSSLGLRTPHDFDAHLQNDPLNICNVQNDNTLSIEHDLSTNTSENPAISSMEVEVSIVAESPPLLDYPYSNSRSPYENPNPMSPQRASKVFGFLTDKRRSRHTDTDRPLPQLPSTFSSPSDDNQPWGSCVSSDNSSESISVSLKPSAVPIPCPNNTHDYIYNPSDFNHFTGSPSLAKLRTQRSDSTSSRFDSHTDNHSSDEPIPFESKLENHSNVDTLHNDGKPQQATVVMTARAKVIVTAPTPSGSDNALPVPRVPRGPLAQAMSGQNTESLNRQRVVGEQSNLFVSRTKSQSLKDLFTPMPSRRRRSQRHNTSRNSSSTQSLTQDVDSTVRISEKENKDYGDEGRSILTVSEKANRSGVGLGLSVKGDLPATPVRSNSHSTSRPFIRSAVNPAMFIPSIGTTPSPASSSELSPVGQRMMMGLRQQRMKAREADRARNSRRFRSGMAGSRV